MKEFDDLYKLVKRLRSESGCPWDRQQTSRTIAFDLIEEAYEINDAIEKDDIVKIREELGDLLFLVLMHIRIKEEEGKFTLEDVIAEVQQKMILRHPHVFGEKKIESLRELLENWEKSKESPLETIPESLPALLMGQKLIEKLRRLNKDIPCKELLDSYLRTTKGDFDEEVIETMKILLNYSCKGKNLEKDLRSLFLLLKHSAINSYNSNKHQDETKKD